MKRALICIFLLCGACVQLGSDPLPMKYYLLQPNAAARQIPLASDLKLSLAPLKLPAYLDRLQLTTHNDQHQVVFAVQDRWSEPLEESLSRVIMENLVRHLQDGRDGSAALASHNENFLVSLTFNSFDGILGQETNVDIRWSILKVGGPEQLLRGHFVEKTPVGSGYADLVQGLNSALNNLSYRLALQAAEWALAKP